MTNPAQQVSDLDQAALKITQAVSALYSAANGDTAVYAIIDALDAQRLLISERSSKIQAQITAASDDYSWLPNEPDFTQD